jgi:hypothetical protein
VPVKDALTPAAILDCEEFHALRARYTTGVRLHELASVAVIAARLACVPQPKRDTRRHFVLLITWFRENWARVAPWLLCIGLRDEGDRPIDGRREAIDRGIRTFQE